MNVRFSLVASAAVACAVITGCKAPKANVSSGSTASVRPARQTEVKTVEKESKPAPAVTETKKPEPLSCKCAPGTVHVSPCKCGAPDCKCKVAAPEPEYTTYRVKGGDTLSGICATYGLKQKDVLALNPGMSPNKLFAGKKIKLPGQIVVKDDAKNAPVAKKAESAKAKPRSGVASGRAAAYTGATKVYVVKSGDTLGKLAMDNGVTVKCLMEMNGLKSRVIRIGQKLKVPAEKPVAVASAKAKAKPGAAESKPVAAKDAPKEEVKAETAPVEAPAPAAPQNEVKEEAPVAPAVTEPAPAPAAEEPAATAKTHTVKEGEDVVSIAIQYGVSPSTIFDLNNIKSTDLVEPGTVLKLPADAKVQ